MARKRSRIKWDHENDEELRVLYPITRTDKLAEKFGCSKYTIYNMAFAMGLKKSYEFLQSPESGRLVKGSTRTEGIRYQFKKGHIPANKGRKQSEYMSQEQIDRTKATRFGRGHIPANHKPVGYERITKDGYVEVKTAEPNVFELKHRLIWVERNGPIPSGCNIQFRDGNKQNFSIDNLYMISRSEQMRSENSYHARYPEEVKKLIQLKGALHRQINKASKNQ